MLPIVAAAVAPAAVEGGGPVQAPPCARHPANAAVTACNRCGDFVCSVCATPVEGAVLCVRCFEFKHGQGELYSQKSGFRLPQTSRNCGIGAIILFWFCGLGGILGISAIVTGILAIRHIRRQPGLPGEKTALSGIIMGSVGTIATVAFILWSVLSSNP
ncbi:MAG: DUF4190 domain-containing protein [Planctomycetota bacterium]